MADEKAGVSLQVRELFDAKAAAWAPKYAPDGRLLSRLTFLVDMVKFDVPAGGSVLDLGSGTGELAAWVAASGVHTMGCGISPQMLGRAAAAGSFGPVGWIQLDRDWWMLPLTARTFDAIAASSVLEYGHDPDAVLRDCRRVLRSSAVLLCVVPDLTDPIHWPEWADAVAAWASLVRALCRHSRRLNAYLTYLAMSGHRHSAH
jgi:SAM-dependent methyltransferase